MSSSSGRAATAARAGIA